MFRVISSPPLQHKAITNIVITLAQIHNSPNDHGFYFMGDFFSWSSLGHCHIRWNCNPLLPFTKQIVGVWSPPGCHGVALRYYEQTGQIVQTSRASCIWFLQPYISSMCKWFLPFRRLQKLNFTWLNWTRSVCCLLYWPPWTWVDFFILWSLPLLPWWGFKFIFIFF